MLKLTRQAGEAIFLDNETCIHVQRVSDDGVVTLRIGAPKNVNIVRSELVERDLGVTNLSNDDLFKRYLEERKAAPA